MARFALHVLIMFLPGAIKRKLYKMMFNYEIHPSAKIGLAVLDAENVTIAENAYIGHFTIIRGLKSLHMGTNARIGKSNRFTAVPLRKSDIFPHAVDRNPSLVMEEHSAIVSKHFFDCNDQIKIGAFSTIAGLGSSFWTHGINMAENQQETAPIEIGSYCLMAAGCVVVKGAKLPDYCALGANSTLHKAYEQTHTLYSGVPAMAVAQLDENYAYFKREKGAVL